MRTVFFQTPRNLSSNILRLLFVMQLVEIVTATWEGIFNYNGTDYSVSSRPKRSEAWGLEVQDHFASLFTDNLKKSNCGNVTWSNVTLDSVISIWNGTVCKRDSGGALNIIQFVRTANNFIQELFENCTIETIKKSADSTEGKQCPNETAKLIGVGCFLGVVGLILAGIVAFVLFRSSCCQRKSYYASSYSGSIQSDSYNPPVTIELDKRTHVINMPDENSPIISGPKRS